MSKLSQKEAKRQKKIQKQARKREQKAKNNKKKGKNMFGFGSAKKTPVYSYQKGTVPTTGKDVTTLSTVLFKQSTLNKIGEICLPAANDSEFQVHYRSLQLIIQKEAEHQRLVITIPTVFFNMPQKVSGASVDFSLDEIAAISESVAPLSEVLAEKYIKAFPTEFFENLGYEIEARENEIGSMHRHPGAFGFSATDLDNKAENPGIIFRTRGAKDRIQVDSVMYIPNTKVNIFTTETRIVDVQPVEDGIEGTYLRTPTFSYIIDDVEAPTDFGAFFGRKSETAGIEFIVDKDSITDEYPEMERLLLSFINTLQEEEDYEPQLIIDPDLITESYSYYNQNGSYYNGNRYGGHTYGGQGRGAHATRTVPVSTTPAKTYDAYDAYEAYDEYTEYDYEAPVHGGSNAPAVAAPDVRPTWRKVQTLGLLKTKGIDVNLNAQITGNGSVVDIRAITKALREEGFSGIEIDEFFTDAAYTDAMLTRAYEAPGGIPEV